MLDVEYKLEMRRVVAGRCIVDTGGIMSHKLWE
jgi:hypothetical protein